MLKKLTNIHNMEIGTGMTVDPDSSALMDAGKDREKHRDGNNEQKEYTTGATNVGGLGAKGHMGN